MQVKTVKNDRTRKCSNQSCDTKLYPGKDVFVIMNSKGKHKAYMCSDLCVKGVVTCPEA